MRLGQPGRARRRPPHAQAWKEKGQGLLTVRQPAGGGPSAVVFTTEAGRVLVNAALYKGIKVVLQVGTLILTLGVKMWCSASFGAGRQSAAELRCVVEAPLLAWPVQGACGSARPTLCF